MSNPANTEGSECKTCRFFEKITFPDAGTDMGYCRRHAPTPGQGEYIDMFQGASPAWPLVHMSEWCGEYKNRTRLEPKRSREIACEEGSA